MAGADPTRVQRDWDAVKDHARTYQDFFYVYPVISRRSGGLSIGVNLNPDKRCNFDCVYCEVDRRSPPRSTRLDLGRVRAELDSMIRYVQEGRLSAEPKFAGLPSAMTGTIKDIAFSGDGEPTLIPNFADAVRVVVECRQQHGLDQAKVVLITDAAGLDKRDVRQGLRIMDLHRGEIWAKLDAGTEAYYRTVNRTLVSFERILRNLLLTARERPIIIQSLFLRLHGRIMDATELSAYCARLLSLTAAGGQVTEVQAYTIARPTPETYATRLTRDELETLATTIRAQTGLPVRVFD